MTKADESSATKAFQRYLRIPKRATGQAFHTVESDTTTCTMSLFRTSWMLVVHTIKGIEDVLQHKC